MPDDPLLALALRVTDGETIDWKAETESETLDPSLVRILEQIDAVARVHGSPDTSDKADTPPEFPSGRYWGSLEIIELIGAGSYGDVYRARDMRLGRDVALKLLRTPGADESDSFSVIREGHLLSRVRHANVVTVYGADCIDGRTGLWMELIEGETLEQEVRRRGALEPTEVVQIGAVLSDALATVHAAGLLHRDVKAQNVMRDRAGRLVLMDFGSGLDAQRFAGPTVEGTPLYAAPEVLNGGQASVRSDIYSLGVLLWYLLTGSYPVNGRSVDEIRRAHALGRNAKLERTGPDGAVGRIAVDCLATDPRTRPASASELGKRLRECVQPYGSRRRPIRNWTGLGAFAAAVLLLSTAPLSLSFKADARAPGAPGEPIWLAKAGVTASGAPSSDGRYFPCRSSEIPVAICNVETQTVQRIPLIGPIEDGFSPPGRSVRPLISSDGKRVAFQGPAHEEVKIFDLATFTSRSLRVDSSLQLRLIEWRASEGSLLVVLSPFFSRPLDGEPHYLSSVALLETDTGTLTTLKRFDETPGGVALSHDGSRLAFTQQGNLYVADLLSGESHQIAAPNVGAVLWMPNDDGIVFTFTSEKNRPEVQVIRLTDGLRVAETEVLRPAVGSHVSLVGVSVTGDVYYNAVTEPMLYIAPFDAVTQLVGPLKAIAVERSRVGMDWSPDSKSIAYARWDQTKMLSTIVIRNLATSVEREIALPSDSANHSSTENRFIRWSPQGTILARDNSSFYLVNLDKTSIERIAASTSFPSSVEWSPNGVTVLEAGSGFLREFDAVTGHTTQSYSLPKVMAMQVSPQQQQLLAFSSLRNVRFGDGLRNGKFEISVQGFESGVARTLLVSDYDQQCLPVGWWKQEIFVACSDASMRLPPLFLLDTLSETMKALDVNLRGIRHVRVRPDDGAIAISASTTNSSGSTFILKLPRRHSQNAPTSVMPQR